MLKIILIFAFFVIAANGCENGFFSFKGRQCVKFFNGKVSYKNAEKICDDNWTIASFEDDEEMEFYRVIAYNFVAINNNVWISAKNTENSTNCPYLTEFSKKVQFSDCEQGHSVICKQLTRSNEGNKLSLDESINKLKESIEKQIINLSTKIDNMNKSMQSSISEISKKTDKLAVPMITMSERHNLNFHEGETVELDCKSIGFATFGVRWIDSNNNLISNNSTLIIENISRFQSGLYTCIAEYEVGKQIVEQYNIQVKHTPIVTVKENKILAGTGLNVTMICNILSNPMPTINWVKIGTGYNKNETEEMSSNLTSLRHINTTHIQSKLVLTLTSRLDMGIFECRAKNEIGEDSSRVELSGSAPINGQIQHVEQINSTAFQVQTTVVSYSPIYSCKLHFRQIPQTVIWEYRVPPVETLVDPANHVYQHLFTFNNLNMKPKYALQMFAQNEFGWGTPSDEFEFQPATYVCGENGKSVNNWRYMISHQSHGSKGFDRLHECLSTVKSVHGAKIEVEFTEFNVTRRNSKSDRVVFIHDDGKEEPITSTIKLTARNEFSVKLFSSSFAEESAGFVLRFKNVPSV